MEENEISNIFVPSTITSNECIDKNELFEQNLSNEDRQLCIGKQEQLYTGPYKPLQLKLEDPEVKVEIVDNEDVIGITLEPLISEELHIKDENEPTDQLMETNTASEYYYCGLCNRKFSDKNNLERHLNSESKPLECYKCDYKCIRKCMLEAHTNSCSKGEDFERNKNNCVQKISHERHAKEKLLNCSVCTSKVHLQYGKTTSFFCTICDYKCKLKSNVQQHMRTHTGEKLFKCTVCGYKTSQKVTLQRHMKIHTVEKTFKCDTCDFKIVHFCNLKQNVKIHADTESEPSNYTRRKTTIDDLKETLAISDTESESEERNRVADDLIKALDKSPESPILSNNSKTSTEKMRVKRRIKHHCKFCDVAVGNFARHLKRRHFDEIEVQKFLNLKKSNPMRKHLINKIRKEGDFCEGVIIPVQGREFQRNNVLPCVHCKGYYSKYTLRRHVKRCHFNSKATTSRHYQSEAQTLLAQNFQPNDPLRISGVLNSLKADDISLVAKKDKIICEVARKYIKSHREKHLKVVAKRYMRRLARFLMEVRKIENNNKLTLLCILHPSKFDLLIAATKSIGDYNSESKTFKSPSLALQMSALLKKAIDAAYSLQIKKKCDSQILNILMITKKLINDDWATKVSIEAGQHLEIKRFDKPPTLIPMTEDLSKMKVYLDNLIMKSKSALEANNKSEIAYRQLIESTYCSLLLFNKRRVGELQRILMETYKTCLNNSCLSEEFEKLLTPSEKILISKLKRVVIVIRDKPGRNFPVLFDNLTQEGVEIAIKHRRNFFENNNIYLFGHCHSENPINGYQIFRKHVGIALGDPKKTICLISKKLRKHLATIFQILKMKDNELEQVASFLGHTVKIHSEWYKLPSDIYQTAKVSKILLLAEENNDEIGKYKGCNLDEIDVGNEVLEDNNDDCEQDNENLETHNTKNVETPLSELRGQKKKIVKQAWSYHEKKVTEDYFKHHIKNKIAPKKEEVLNLMKSHPTLFKNRKWPAVKAYVYNQYSKT